MIDSVGIYGFILHYCLLFAFFGSALMVFIYLWKIKRLDMEEKPKYTLFEVEDE
jgi:hypothetical protein